MAVSLGRQKGEIGITSLVAVTVAACNFIELSGYAPAILNGRQWHVVSRDSKSKTRIISYV